MGQDAYGYARIGKLADRSQTQSWPWRQWFQQARQRFIQRRHGDMHANHVSFCNLSQQGHVAADQIRFRCDADLDTPFTGNHLQHLARDPETPLGGLIRVGGCADPNRFAVLYFLQFLAKWLWPKPLGKDLSLKEIRIPQLHKLMRITRIAVLATEFTPAIRVDGPHEQHPRAGSSTDKPAGFELQILHSLLGFERGTRRSQACNADELGRRVILKKHNGPASSFVFSSPLSQVILSDKLP